MKKNNNTNETLFAKKRPLIYYSTKINRIFAPKLVQISRKLDANFVQHTPKLGLKK